MKKEIKLPDIDGIIVHCAHTEIVPIGKLKPYPANNKNHPDTQLDLLSKAIKAQGWRAPITVSAQSGYIVRGHARLEAAKRLGLKSVPVDYQNYASVEAERMDRIADNRLAEIGTWNMENLKTELLELDTGAQNMELAGYDESAMEDLMTQFDYRLNEFHVKIEPLSLTGIAIGCYTACKWRQGKSDDYKKFLEWKKNPSTYPDRTQEMARHVTDLVEQWARGWKDFIITVPPQGASKGREYPAGFLGKEVASILDVDFVTIFNESTEEKKHHYPLESLELSPPSLKIKPDIPILIIDDVVTSGATVKNCLLALRGFPCWFFAWIGCVNRTLDIVLKNRKSRHEDIEKAK